VPGNGSVDEFFARHGTRPLAPSERRLAFDLLELQRDLLRTSTSCGWFFDDVAGIESRQVIAYAVRAVEIAERNLGAGFDEPFKKLLAEARGNDPSLPDARAVFDDIVASRPLIADPTGAPVDARSGFEEALLAVAEGVEGDPADLEAISTWRRLVELTPRLPFPVELWSVQNIYARLRTSSAGRQLRDPSGPGHPDFEALRELLSFAPER